jgi:hypothetical protein
MEYHFTCFNIFKLDGTAYTNEQVANTLNDFAKENWILKTFFHRNNQWVCVFERPIGLDREIDVPPEERI